MMDRDTKLAKIPTLIGSTTSTGPSDTFPAFGSKETKKSIDSPSGKSLILSNSMLNPVENRLCLSAVNDIGIKLGFVRMQELVFTDP